MLDVQRTSLPERMPSCVSRQRQLPHHHSVVIVETRHISRTIGSPMELVASETQGEGERQRQKQRRERRFERQRKRTRERDAEFFGAHLWDNCKTRGAVHLLPTLSIGIQIQISTVCCRSVRQAHHRRKLRSPILGHRSRPAIMDTGSRVSSRAKQTLVQRPTN